MSKRLLLAQQHEAWSADDWSRGGLQRPVHLHYKMGPEGWFRPEFVQRVATSGRTVVSVWGYVTQDGLGPLVRIHGALTADKYSNILDTVGLTHITSRMTPQHDYFPARPLAGSPCQKVNRQPQQRGVTVPM
ncbi:hypothetical protein MTO96_038778 [Rhipicephalus appendiculatus]